MATSREYIDWVCERLAPYGEVRRRAMFGEYIVSLNGKNVVSVCDNCVFVKELPALAETFRDAERGFPYDGAKEHYSSTWRIARCWTRSFRCWMSTCLCRSRERKRAEFITQKCPPGVCPAGIFMCFFR